MSVTRIRGGRFQILLFAAVIVMVAIGALDTAWAQTGPFGMPRTSPAGGFAGWILSEQAGFYRALSGTIRAAKTDGSALWTLMGISFAYGVFHAAGPGHGKAVISSYLVANEETWRRGVILSFASSMLQALTAVVIVSIAAALLGATAKMMGDTVRVIEVVSYGLIVLLGARMLWVKGRGFLAAIHAARSKSDTTIAAAHDQHHHYDHHHGCAHDHPVHHDHGHTHDHHEHDHHEHDHHEHDHRHDHEAEADVLPWGHAHGPEPEQLEGPGGWRRGFSAVIAVGLRPCSGAILVLVFALAQGLFWAGIASTFIMGLGTTITVATIATLAVGASALAQRFAARQGGYGTVVLRGIEVGAAALVLIFGALLLTGYMASERLVGV